jgi:hypothetical protein
VSWTESFEAGEWGRRDRETAETAEMRQVDAPFPLSLILSVPLSLRPPLFPSSLSSFPLCVSARLRRFWLHNVIAPLARAIREIAAACEARRYQEAENLFAAAIDKTYQRYPHLEDSDITRTLTMAPKIPESDQKI